MMVRKSQVTEFDPNRWAKAYKINAERGGMNSMMDSGWSGATAQQCADQQRLLLFELFQELQKVEIVQADFFDRPRLAAVLAAVYEASK